MSRLPGVQVELLVPATWKNEYSNKVMSPGRLSDLDFPVHHLPIAAPGSISLHVYLRGIKQLLRRSRPDIVFLDEEPWSLSAAQVAAACRLHRIPFVCYT